MELSWFVMCCKIPNTSRDFSQTMWSQSLRASLKIFNAPISKRTRRHSSTSCLFKRSPLHVLRVFVLSLLGFKPVMWQITASQNSNPRNLTSQSKSWQARQILCVVIPYLDVVSAATDCFPTCSDWFPSCKSWISSHVGLPLVGDWSFTPLLERMIRTAMGWRFLVHKVKHSIALRRGKASSSSTRTVESFSKMSSCWERK